MEKKNTFFYGWAIVIGCILITMTMVPPIMALSNKYLIYVTEDLGISRSAFTLANTILQGLGIFISPIVSKNLAKGNMKKIQSISIIGFVLCYASYSFATKPIHLYISAFFVGIFYLNATLIPVSMMITNWFVKKRGLAMSLAMAGIGVGGTIFSPILTFLLESYGWRNTYRIMALIILIIALPTSLFLLKRSPEDMGLCALGAEETASTSQSTSAAKPNFLNLSVSESKGKLFFWLILLGMLTNGIINSGALGQFPPAIQEAHGAELQAAIISLYSLIGIGGKIVLGWINDKFGVAVSSIFGCCAFAAAFLFMLASGTNASMLYPMAIVFGLGNAIGTVSPPLVTAEVFGQDKYSEAYGIANSFTQIGLSVGSLLVAAMYDINGSYTTAWMILFACAIITLVSWVGSVSLSKKYKAVEEKTEEESMDITPELQETF
jgi:MFS family permease